MSQQTSPHKRRKKSPVAATAKVLGLIPSPLRSWQERRTRSREVREYEAELRRSAAAGLESLHELIWEEWEAQGLPDILEKGEPT